MIKTYEDCKVTVLRSTQCPEVLVHHAIGLTMHKDPTVTEMTPSLCKFLLTAEHASVFEHATITFLIEGCSRSFLAQVTRQRTFSFTSGSQHYQPYGKYPAVVHKDLIGNKDMECAINVAYGSYDEMVSNNIPIEEARQALPNAAAVNIMITCDARNLVSFFRARRCERNVTEMIMVADAMWRHCVDWFPALFGQVGAPCVMDGKCNQCHMKSPKCKAPIDADFIRPLEECEAEEAEAREDAEC